MISVIVPAHDEERVIGRLLAGLLPPSAQVEVIVVCNGCTDATATVARGFGPPVTVVEIPEASKPAALNAGDRLARHFPRLYVDADVELTYEALEATARALSAGALAAAPRLVVDTSGSPWPVRAYYRTWQHLPYASQALVGAGVIGLSREGRRRFDTFPDLISDDMFVHGLFDDTERVSVGGACFVAHAPRRTPDLLRRLTRAYAGNMQLEQGGVAGGGRRHGLADLRRVVRDQQAGVADLAAYLALTVTAKARGRVKLARGRTGVWERDQSSRDQAGIAA